MKKPIALTLIIISLLLLIPFEVSPTNADATSDFSWRNWADVEVVYLGEGSITLKLTFELLGYTLHNNTDIVVSTVKSGGGWIVQTNAVTIKAWYSNDKNMTIYEYTLSSQDTDIKPSGYFPSDSWEITVHVVTQFPVQFNDNLEFSATSSPNYFCKYYVSAVQSDLIDHVLFISIQHPSSFAFFVYVTYFLPFSLLLMLFLFLIRILHAHWDKIEEVRDSLLVVSIGSVVFIPVYQLPLSDLKIPFLLTLLDSLFIGLFIAYFSFIIVLIRKETKVNSNPTSVSIPNSKEQTELNHEKSNESSEEKIDRLLHAFEEDKRERKKARILAKIDGLHNVLIALSTFIIGLIITQNKFLIGVNTVGILFSMVGVVLSILFSFVIGFKGMVGDLMEQRVLSWVLLLTCFVSFLFIILAFVANHFLGLTIWATITSAILGGIIYFVQVFFAKRFTKWLESRLTSLLGEKVDEWNSIKKSVFGYVLYIIAIALVVSVVIVLLGSSV